MTNFASIQNTLHGMYNLRQRFLERIKKVKEENGDTTQLQKQLDELCMMIREHTFMLKLAENYGI